MERVVMVFFDGGFVLFFFNVLNVFLILSINKGFVWIEDFFFLNML